MFFANLYWVHEGTKAMPQPASINDLDPDLRRLLGEFQAVNKDTELLVRGLAVDQLAWKPEPGKWSIAQCLDHLTVTARADLPHIRNTIRNARSHGLFGQGPFKYGLLSRWLIQLMDAPVRMRFRTPRVYAPSSEVGSSAVVENFFRVQEEVIDCIRDANGLDLVRAKVSVPVRKFIKLSLGQEFALIAAHERRHVLQAQRVKARLP
jgi:hypothetical protein